MYDVAIIGAGVVGAMTARTLARYDLSVLLLEKANDVATGATKANSAIVHAGFDAKPGSLKAKLNVEGSRMMETVCRELGVKYKRNGSLVIGLSEEDEAHLRLLLARGEENGVTGLRLLGKEEVHQLEPNLSDAVTCALYAPTGAIVCPYDLAISAIGNAMDNGVELLCNFPVRAVQETEGGFALSDGERTVSARFVVNCASVYSDEIAALFGDTSFGVHPRKGEYLLFDKECGGLLTHTVFRTPSAMGKGILVSPTVDGNLLLGPTSEDGTDKENKDTTAEGISRILESVREELSTVPAGKTITSFTGLRAVGSTGDFILTSPRPGLVNAAGIESPGLSASPAIAEYILELLRAQGLSLSEKAEYNPIRVSMHAFREATMEEKNEMIRQNPAYGRIVCRCEQVTEGEILDAIRQNPRARDLDGVKRRTRAQMGRCQGGFCVPYIIELLAREWGVPFESITKNGGGSVLNVGKTKEDGLCGTL